MADYFFNLIDNFFNLLSQRLEVFLCRCFACFVRIILRYFIIFEVVVKGVDALISLSVHYLIGEHLTFFNNNIVASHLTKGFIVCRSSLVEILVLLFYNIILFANDGTLVSFLICIPLICFRYVFDWFNLI